jgi:RNA polymerase sigma-70 factor (ECF subfamily)
MKSGPDDLIPTRWSLIKRLKDWDDDESWREFFETYWRLIYGTAVRAGLSDVEAQDAVQETVISVCRNIDSLEATPDGGSFKNWLLRMTRWRIIDQIRKRQPLGTPAPRRLDPSKTPTTECIPDPAGNELEKVWEEEWRGNLTQAALARVQRQTSARHFQIFYLYVIGQTPVSQVATATGTTPDEVYVVKHRLWPLFEKAMKAVEGYER